MTLDKPLKIPRSSRVSFQRFSVKFPSFTLAPISLEIMPGERVAFVGPNGSGKTTTLRALAGRLVEYDGTIRIDGRDARQLLPLGRRNIGLLADTLGGYGWMTVREHFAFVSGFYPAWDNAYSSHLAERLRVPLNEALGRLSKGTRVKVSFIAAEAYRPPILLLDEPTAGLDPDSRAELFDIVLASQNERGDRTTLFSTHLLEDVELVADRVLLIANGTLRLDARVSDLVASRGGISLVQILRDALAPVAS